MVEMAAEQLSGLIEVEAEPVVVSTEQEVGAEPGRLESRARRGEPRWKLRRLEDEDDDRAGRRWDEDRVSSGQPSRSSGPSLGHCPMRVVARVRYCCVSTIRADENRTTRTAALDAVALLCALSRAVGAATPQQSLLENSAAARLPTLGTAAAAHLAVGNTLLELLPRPRPYALLEAAVCCR
ncbi:hypothetical protein Dimus_023158 [Dionaea muscipula]